MEVNPFQNGNEMNSVSWDTKMEIAKCKWIHFIISILILNPFPFSTKCISRKWKWISAAENGFMFIDEGFLRRWQIRH